MIYINKAELYRRLAQRYLEEGCPEAALQCATEALRLDPNGQRAEVGRILGELTPGLLKPNGQRSAEVQRIDRWKRKLDLSLAEEKQILLPPPADSGPSDDDEDDHEAVPVNLLRALDEVIARIQRERESEEPECMQVLPQLGRLRQRLGASHPDVKPPSGAVPDDDDGYWDTWRVSIPHELHNLGNDFYKAGFFDESVQVYTAALELRSELLETYFNRALAYTRLSMYASARADLDKVIELNENLAECFYTRGLVHEYEQEYEAALADYRRALEIDPNYTRAQTQIEVVKDKLQSRSSSSGGPARSGVSEEEGQIRDFEQFRVKPECRLSDVGGHQRVKRRMKALMAWLRGDAEFASWGVQPPRGVLLCGQPGVGKTHLARALAGEVDCPFYAPPPSVFEDMYAGNTQKNLRGMWNAALKHPQAIIFVDEFDSIAQKRSGHRRTGEYWYSRIVGCLLALMDDLQQSASRLVVMAATNCRQDIDEAFLRPGRFSYVINVGAPTEVELAEIWLIHLEAAALRATRDDFFAEPLARAVGANRQAWLADAFRAGSRDPSGIVRLARRAHAKELVGDHVRELIRRTVEERAMVALEMGHDLGPIGPDDLLDQLDGYDPDFDDDDNGDDGPLV